MSKENELLDFIAQNERISQRELSSKTGLSLGNVNLLIKKMVKKGLIKIERLKPNSLRYILTPKGLAEKSKKTYNYIVHSVKYLLRVKKVLENILYVYIHEKHYKVYLYGSKEEVYEIIHQIIRESDYQGVEYISELTARVTEAPDTIIIVWEPEYESEVSGKGVHYLNILCLI